MTCSNCAAEMPEISAFCPVCGRPVSAPAEVSAAGTRDALLGGLAYLTVVPAIVLLSVPALRSSRFVRFHSWQSVFFAVAAVVTALVMKLLFAIFSVLPAVGLLLAWLSLGVAVIGLAVAWVALAVKAVQGQGYQLPVIGRIAAKLSA